MPVSAVIFISVPVLTVCGTDSGLVTVLPDSAYSRLNLSAIFSRELSSAIVQYSSKPETPASENTALTE